MVHDGFAWWYRQYAPKSKVLEQAEAEAQTERRALWADKESGAALGIQAPGARRENTRFRRSQAQTVRCGSVNVNAVGNIWSSYLHGIWHVSHLKIGKSLPSTDSSADVS